MSNAIVPPSPPTRKINLTVNILRLIDQRPDLYNETTRELRVPYPEEFLRSTNRRFVNVISIRAIQLRKKWTASVQTKENGNTVILSDEQLIAKDANIDSWEEYLPDLYTLHASFVHDDYNDDKTVAWLNEPMTEPRRYEQFQIERDFRLWVVDAAAELPNQRVDLCNPQNPNGGFLRLPIKKDYTMYKYYYVLVVQLLLEF